MEGTVETNSFILQKKNLKLDREELVLLDYVVSLPSLNQDPLLQPSKSSQVGGVRKQKNMLKTSL